VFNTGKHCRDRAIERYKEQKQNGTPVWTHATYEPIKDPKGVVLKVIKFTNDITEEVNMRKSFELLSTANKPLATSHQRWEYHLCRSQKFQQR